MITSLNDLSADQITLLKQKMLINSIGKTSWAELSNADNLISDSDLLASVSGREIEDCLGYEYEHACYSY